MTEGVARAYATLHRGADFFVAWLQPADGRLPATHAHRSKVIANGLRELDRFLNLLLDEVSIRHGLVPARNQHNTANKLRDLCAALGVPNADDARLRALGRVRACLFHCAGLAARGDTAQAPLLTLGWHDATGRPRRVALDQAIVIERADLERIRQFYTQIAASVMCEAECSKRAA